MTATEPAKVAHFVIRLLPPRPTFPGDMTPEEGRLMNEHAAYWSSLMQRGIAVAFGPVLDPKGAWGLGLVELADPQLLSSLEQEDPIIRANLGFRYEVLPMAMAVVRPA